MLQRYPGLERTRVVEGLAEATSGHVAIGHHGTVEPLAAAGPNRVLDYTCPFIARSDQQAAALAEAGYDLVLFGKQGNHHCEFAKAAAINAGRVGIIGESVAALLHALQEPGRQWACLGQVTANVERWQQFKSDLLACGVPVRVVDTVCTDSHDRQAEGRRLASECDVVLVVDDHGGSTQSLFEQCQAINPRTHRHDWLANPSLEPALFGGAHSVAVIGGIHVPDWILGEVAHSIQRACASQPTEKPQPRGALNKTKGSTAQAEVLELLDLPLPELLHRAITVHRAYHDPCAVELATLLSIKTGGCPEDCAYCPQSVHHDTGVAASKLASPDEVREAALRAKAAGAQRFCMGAAWREPKDRDVEKVADLVRTVKACGLESCATLGMLSASQAHMLANAGLDYYNHNLDTAPEFYGQIITTRDYQARLDTLGHVRDAGVRVCAGGILGMGETRAQRAGLIAQLANLDPYPESVPINQLVRVAGTPLADAQPLDPLEFIRVIAAARITMPRARVRLSAGRQQLGSAAQALAFLAGANSIFYGEKLLTTGNPDVEAGRALLTALGMHAAGD